MGGKISYGRLEDQVFVENMKLGEGAFGVVYRGKMKDTNQYVAVKKLSKHCSGAGRNRESYEKEMELMRRVKSEYVVSLHAAFEDAGNIQLVLDYCEGGDLGDKIRHKGKSMDTRKIQCYTHQIVSAIGALHAISIIHRDVKPDNFLLSTGPNGESTLKLADFGVAEVMPSQELLKVKCGTPAFMAPEQHILPNGDGYGFPVDIWAIGVTLYMLIHNGQHPFIKNGGLDMPKLNKGMQGNGSFSFSPAKILKGSCLVPDIAQQLCNEMLTDKPKKRPTAEELLRHRWLRLDSAASHKP